MNILHDFINNDEIEMVTESSDEKYQIKLNNIFIKKNKHDIGSNVSA